MSTEQKGKMVSSIMVSLKSKAFLENKHFDEGVFFNLIFMTDKELVRISNLCK